MISNNDNDETWYRKYGVYEMSEEEIQAFYLRQILWIYLRCDGNPWGQEERELYDPIRFEWKYKSLAQLYQDNLPIYWYKD